MALPTPPPPAPRRAPITGILVGAAAAVVLGVVVFALGQPDPDSPAGPGAPPSSAVTATASASPTPSPSPETVPPRQRPEVRAPFSEQAWAKGSDLFLAVVEIKERSQVCRVHGYRVGTKTLGAYGSDCTNWPDHELLFFWAVLRNVDDQATSFNLRHFVLASQDGRTFGPVSVRSQADSPPNFLPETGKVPPRSNIAGYLTFDDRVAGVIAARLSYVSKDQTLTIVFDGKHVVS